MAIATRTLTQLIAGVRQLANVQNSTFVLDAELTDRINEAVKELYDLIVSTYENYYVVATENFVLAGGQTGNSQALADIVTSFYKDNTLEWNPGSSNMRVVRRLPSDLERDSASGRTYDILGTPPVLYVYPPEESAGTYRLKYTPDAPFLADAAITLDLTSGLNAVDGTTNTWTFANASFTAADVGKTLTITGATNPLDNGDFVISSIVSGTDVITAGYALGSESFAITVTASYVLAGSSVALDATMNKWYEYVQIRAAIEVHRKRAKIAEAMELAGSENDPRPGTLAYVRKNVLSLARNRQAQPQQVPLGRRRASFWDWDDTP